ncbi:hypothetical protein TrLO_g4562 [Triparma laevis f. longispina]|uniref:RING-type domain-containing protein n=1 Tax=Triparma laevis f. longispina TaxID=1714387 RepID=A0A9W7FV87_9STRA|nr:hypothetical protein TrLO_g4562 [Triparma laevis f. longispina]
MASFAPLAPAATTFSYSSNPLAKGSPPKNVSLTSAPTPTLVILHVPLFDLLFLSSSSIDEKDIETGAVTLYNLLIAYSSNKTSRGGLKNAEVVVAHDDGSFAIFLTFVSTTAASTFCNDLTTINRHADNNHSNMYKFFSIQNYRPTSTCNNSPNSRPSSPPPPTFTSSRPSSPFLRPSSPRSKTACPICFHQLEQACTYKNICGHEFHLMCLVQWCSSTCPVCRLSLESFHESGDEVDDILEPDHDTAPPQILPNFNASQNTLLCSPAQSNPSPSPSPSNASHLTEHYAKSQCHHCRLLRRTTYDSPDSKPAACTLVPTPSSSLTSRTPSTPSTPKTSSQGLWLCLVCASLTCGDSKNPKGSGHTHQHYLQTLHTYYQQVGGNRVYDFAGEGWVSRLISSEGGKIVAGMEGEDYRTEDLVEIEDMWGEKLEGMAGEFKRVLKDELERGREDIENRIADMKLNYKAIDGEETSPQDVIIAMRKSEKLMRKRLKTTSTTLETTTKDLKFSQDLVESLEKTRGRWKDEVEKATAELDRIRQTYSETVCPLEDKVEKLMLMLDGG